LKNALAMQSAAYCNAADKISDYVMLMKQNSR